MVACMNTTIDPTERHLHVDHIRLSKECGAWVYSLRALRANAHITEESTSSSLSHIFGVINF